MIRQEDFFEQRRIFHGHVPYVCGTRLDVIICGLDSNKCSLIWGELCALVEDVDAMLNRFCPTSEVSLINASGSMDGMSPELSEMVRLCAEYTEKSGGVFDVRYDGGKLDFGGFAKGYVLRKYSDILNNNDVKSAFVNFGNSSIMGIGSHPYGDSWSVDVLCPFTGRVLDTVKLVDMSMSTSGNTPSYSEHIVNPKTGESVSCQKTVVAVCPDPLDAEILSTVAMIDKEGAWRLKSALDGAEFTVFD